VTRDAASAAGEGRRALRRAFRRALPAPALAPASAAGAAALAITGLARAAAAAAALSAVAAGAAALPAIAAAAAAALFAVAAPAAAHAATANAAAPPFEVHVTLEPAVIGVDETATLTIEASGGGFSSLRFEPNYQLDNLQPVEGPSRFEDLSLINGSLSRSFRFSLRLRPMAAGPARVRSLVLELRGQQVRLPDQEIRVQEQATGRSGGPGAGVPGHRLPDPEELFDDLFGGRGSSPARPPRAEGPAAFLRAEVQPQQPLVGEQALYTLYLYTRQDVAAISATAMPSFRGFWVRDLPQPERLVPEMVGIGDERYGRVPMVRKALFALRPGHHLLEPAGCDVVVEQPTRSFFSPPVPRSEELHLSTPELAVEVQPLPAAPAGFGGLVGQVSLAATLQPYRLRLGQGATLAVTLAGAGNLQGVPAPRLELPPGLTAFPPQQQSEDHVSGATVEGRRTWTFVLVPTRPGSFSVRPQSVSFFDPAHRAYRLAQAPALDLTALPAPAATPSGAGAGSGAAGLHPIRSAALREPAARPWWSPPRTWAGLLPWLALAWLVVLAVLLARRRTLAGAAARPPGATTAALAAATAGGASSGGGSAGAVAGGAAVDAREGAAARPAEVERKLREAAREDRPRQAAALVEEGWRGYLAGRWGLPATTPPARWGAALVAQGATSDVAEDMARLVEELHYLRFAPQLSTTGAVRDEVLARSRQLLRRLR